MRGCSLKHIFYCLIVLVFIYVVFHPDRHAKIYSYISDDNILSKIISNYVQTSTDNLQNCEYKQMLESAFEIFDINDLFKHDYNNIIAGGEYTPDCLPKFSTAVIVCYRNRTQQLDAFIRYMHSYLPKQNIHYRIFIAEQNDSAPFNRALMLNYGSMIAMKYNFSCLILHDVDLLPLNSGNIYACTQQPRHMSCSIDIMRFNLPYYEIVGGVLAIQSEQYKLINGMSNQYYGWGGEDDDLYRRMIAKKLHPIRFSPWISKYTMLFHKHETPSPNRYTVLADSLKRQESDGLNTLDRNYEVKLRPLFTHVIVN